MRTTVLLWTLILLVPCTNLRMICVDHTSPGKSTPVAASPACDEMCPRDAAPRTAPLPGDPSGCLLVAGGCSAISAVGVTLPPPPLVLPAPAPVWVAVVPDPDLYVGPIRPSLGRPPRS